MTDKILQMIKRASTEFNKEGSHWKVLYASVENRKNNVIILEVRRDPIIDTLKYIYKKDGELLRIERLNKK